MKGRLQTIVLLLLAAAVLVFLGRRFFPNEEKRIRRVLMGLAEVASVPERATATGRLAAAERLRDLLCFDVELDVDVPGEGPQSLQGRAEIIQAAMAAREHLAGLKVELFDIRVLLDPDRSSATAELTARATLRRQKEYFVQELRLRLRKDPQDWRVCRIETVQTLQR